MNILDQLIDISIARLLSSDSCNITHKLIVGSHDTAYTGQAEIVWSSFVTWICTWVGSARNTDWVEENQVEETQGGSDHFVLQHINLRNISW